MIESPDFRTAAIPLNHGGGHIRVLGFGALIPDAGVTISAAKGALAAGFRHFDCAERYRNEREAGEVLQAGLAAAGIRREDIFVTTKLWNSNHRPERVRPALEASPGRLGLHCADLYLMRQSHAPAVKDVAVPIPRILFIARLKCKRSVGFCGENNIVFLAFAPLGHGIRPGPLEDPVVSAIAARIDRTPGQMLPAWAIQRGTVVLTTPNTGARARENFNISAHPEEAFDEINRIQTRQRFNAAVNTGSPGFIPQSR